MVLVGGECYYAMACCAAQLDQIDEAIYWLQRSAHEVGIDAREAAREDDLRAVWRDPRGNAVLQI